MITAIIVTVLVLCISALGLVVMVHQWLRGWDSEETDIYDWSGLDDVEDEVSEIIEEFLESEDEEP